MWDISSDYSCTANTLLTEFPPGLILELLHSFLGGMSLQLGLDDYI